MKSLHLTNAWHTESGGVATHYRSLLAEAERQGRELALLVPGEADATVVRGTTRIHTVRAPQSPLNNRYRMIMPNAWPGVNARVAQIVRAEQPDLIEICDKYSLHYLAGLIRKGYFRGLRKRPVLIGMSCERMDENLRVYLTRSPWGGTFARWYTKWIYFGFFDHHIVNSQHTAEELRIAARGHITERGIWVRTPGVDLQDFTGITPDPNWRTNHNVPAHAAVILYVGRLAPEKNLDLLFDACDLLGSQQPFHLVIVGDGIERPRLEQRLPSSRNVTFLGHLTNRAALAQTYRNADVFVHPNPNEPFGIAPLEAMASGLAFVGPRSGGVLTYANDDNAWLADPHPAAFAQAILKALSPDRHQRLRAARETARHYESRATANRFLELYKEFVDRGTTASADYVSTPGTRWGIEHLGSP